MINKNTKNSIMYSILDKNKDKLYSILRKTHGTFDFDVKNKTPFIHFFVDNFYKQERSVLNKHDKGSNLSNVLEDFWETGFDNGRLFVKKDGNGVPAIFNLLKNISESNNKYLKNILISLMNSENFDEIFSSLDNNNNGVLHFVATLTNPVCNFFEERIEDIALISNSKNGSLLNTNNQNPLHKGIARNGSKQTIEIIYDSLLKNNLFEFCDKDLLEKTVSDYAIISRKHFPFIVKKGFFKQNLNKDMIHALVHNLSALINVKGEFNLDSCKVLSCAIGDMSKDDLQEMCNVEAMPHPYVFCFLAQCKVTGNPFENEVALKKVDLSMINDKSLIEDNLDYIHNHSDSFLQLYDYVVPLLEKRILECSVLISSKVQIFKI